MSSTARVWWRSAAKHLHVTPQSAGERLGAKVPADLEAILLMCFGKEIPTPDRRAPRSCKNAFELAPTTAAGTPHAALEWWDEYGEALQAQSTPGSSDGFLTIDMASSKRGQ